MNIQWHWINIYWILKQVYLLLMEYYWQETLLYCFIFLFFFVFFSCCMLLFVYICSAKNQYKWHFHFEFQLNCYEFEFNFNFCSETGRKPVGNRSETVQSKSVTFGILQDSFPILFKGTGLQNPIWYAPEPHGNRFETVPKLLLNCPESASRTRIFSNEGQRLIKYWHMHREKTRMFVSSCWWFLFFFLLCFRFLPTARQFFTFEYVSFQPVFEKSTVGS